jgi:hypothetical protein
MSEIAYLPDGEAVEVVERTSSGVIVRRILGNDEDEWRGDPEVVPQVFGAPLTERKASVIQELEAREEKLRERISELQRQVREREDAEKRLLRLANHSQAIARLDDLISGRTTHYLIREAYYPMKLVEAVNGGIPYVENDYGRTKIDGTKLLVLFGKSGGDLQWMVNQYRDHSGSSWTEVEPFTSREAALSRMQEIVNAYESEKDYKWGQLYSAAVEYDLRIPTGLREAVTKQKVDAAAAEVAGARKKLEIAEAALRAARGEV